MRIRYLPLLLGLSLLLSGCPFGGIEPDRRPQYKPILMARTQLEAAVVGLAPRPLHVPGKIFVGGRYLFINEQYQGIHVFDNADPAKPLALGFLRIPGNVDLAVRGTLLYADNGPDLVVLDLSDPARMRVAGRTRNAMTELSPPVIDFTVPAQYEAANRPANTVVVGWELVKPAP